MKDIQKEYQKIEKKYKGHPLEHLLTWNKIQAVRYEFLGNIEEANKFWDRVNAAKKFYNLAKEKGFVISRSPFSKSTYAHKENEEITNEFKPEGSLRISDHWEWKTDTSFIKSLGETKTHCIANFEGYNGLGVLQVAEMKNGIYELI